MTGQRQGIWSTMGLLSLGLLLGIGGAGWLHPQAPLPKPSHPAAFPYEPRLGQLEQAVAALTQALAGQQRTDAAPEPTPATLAAQDEDSRQALAHLIREEVRQAVAEAGPEAQRAREEALVEAELRNSPENRAAYQSASDVVQAAVAAKRWTEEDKEDFRAAFGRLTNTQRMDLMNLLAPAINSGEIKVEVSGPLF